ncbi:ATP-binding protein [Nucisporomicrobium flavum]|uniref:ATP-binding protein n=1 Tax=Nucisporomicrobium flavum TaxID=2785915 RepID=UPI0018F4842D|nr:ATP-binding protein [Nucisporomicrobium flavum]
MTIDRTAEVSAFLEAAEAAVPGGIAFLDGDLRFVRVSPAFEAVVGEPAAALIGRPASGALTAAPGRLLDVLREVRGGGAPVSDLRIDAAPVAGRRRRWRIDCRPTPDGVCLLLSDVTEEETAAALRNAFMRDMPEGLYTVDDAGRLTSLNRAASEMLGWAESELLGRSMHDTVHRPAADGSPAGVDQCALRRPAAMTEEVFVRRDGTPFQVVCSVAPLHEGSGVPGAVVTFRDVTEARRADLEAHHDQKLESLGRLSAGLAHEINTPIQFVGDNTRFLADAYEDMWQLLMVYRGCLAPELGEMAWDERTARAREAEEKADVEYLVAEIPAAVRQTLDGVERVASLVRAMKSFSYKDTAEQSYADLNEAIRTTLTVARNEVKYVADVELDLGDLPEVLCHRGDLNQVFLNLLVNAADAMEGREQRGRIEISTRSEGPEVVIRFTDDGCGIPEHIRQSIFDPFFTTKGVGKGSGQGLALARAVLDRHGGSIDVQSEPGRGSTFTLRLPVNGRPDA